ncbi:MAG: hypothetical protein HY713_11265 [candidate division NC10 bacterium]|nr:hypothetical protein [candidate division NC10 bacterium]
MRRGLAPLLALACLTALPAAGQIRRADFVILAGDTDDAIRLAKNIKDFFAADPTARRVVSQAREVLVQSWLEEKSPAQLTDQERAAVQNPERHDAPVLHDVTVALTASPPSIVLSWDIPLRVWPRLAGSVGLVANRIVRDGALFARRALQLRVNLQGAETYRVNADVDGNVTVVFIYE